MQEEDKFEKLVTEGFYVVPSEGELSPLFVNGEQLEVTYLKDITDIVMAIEGTYTIEREQILEFIKENSLDVIQQLSDLANQVHTAHSVIDLAAYVDKIFHGFPDIAQLHDLLFKLLELFIQTL